MNHGDRSAEEQTNSSGVERDVQAAGAARTTQSTTPPNRNIEVGRDVQAAGAARTPQTTDTRDAPGAQAAGAARAPRDPPSVQESHQETNQSHPDACATCRQIVNWSSIAIQCDGCNRWSHKECISMDNSHYQHLEAVSSIWLCQVCGFNNIHPSLFEQTYNSTTSFTFDITNSPGAPNYCSTPTNQNPTTVNKNSLKIINVNCQSLWAKRLEFSHLVESTKPDVVIGTESWLHENISNSSVFPEDFTVYRRDRGTRGGGVFILVKNTIKSTRETELETECEVIWCKIDLKNNKKLLIGAFYRPNESDEESITQLSTALRSLHSSKSLIILGGDFNTPGWDWTTNQPKPNCRFQETYEELANIMDDTGLQQLVEEPTRGQNTLDLLYSNSPGRVCNTEVLPGISDHNIPSCVVDIIPLRRIQKPRWITLYNKADWANIANELKSFKAKIESKEHQLDINTLWNDFKSMVQHLVETYIPRKKTKRVRKLPYITPEIERLIRKRNRLYKKLKKHQTAFNRSSPSFIKWDNKLRELKKDIQKKMRRAYWTYIESTLTTNDDENQKPYEGMKKFWQFIKLNRNEQQGVPTLKANGKVSITATDRANTLNNQFQSVFNAQEIPQEDLLQNSTHPTSGNIEITSIGIEKLLRKLKPHKAAGPDEISARFLKEMAQDIAPILQTIFQLSYNSSEIPEDWRHANVVPVYKKGQAHDPANYRPISLTCICCKVMEHIIVSNIMHHARRNNILYPMQHGFLSRRSCETQLLEFTTDILENMEHNHQTDVLIMDFAKAFDKVSHPHLMKKLEYYGIRGLTNKWISSFLSNRQQRVLIEGEKSEAVPVTSGVPQGSVLGPSLFIYYINDLATSLKSTVRLFADDTVAYLAIKGNKDAEDLQSDLNKLGEWETKWRMQFHPSKCQVISITKRRNTIDYVYTLHGHTLEHVKEAKYLGINITNDLKWSAHINNIIGKASKSLGFLKRNLQINQPKLKEQAYKSLVRPHLEYSSTIWDPSTKTDIEKLEMVQRRSARFVLNRYRNTSSVGSMLNQLKWPSLEERRKHARLAMLYKITNDLVDTPGLKRLLKPTLRPSRHNNTKAYIIPETPKDYIKNSYLPRTIREWNILPESIVTAPNIDSFKIRLKNPP